MAAGSFVKVQNILGGIMFASIKDPLFPGILKLIAFLRKRSAKT